jgi:hypothetical protein
MPNKPQVYNARRACRFARQSENRATILIGVSPAFFVLQLPDEAAAVFVNTSVLDTVNYDFEKCNTRTAW